MKISTILLSVWLLCAVSPPLLFAQADREGGTPVLAPEHTGPTLDERLEHLAAMLERKRESTHVAGMAFALVKDDEVVFARGFGFADLEAERAATPETLFAIGSTTKAFTATCIGMLIDEGKMAWDDPVTRFLPTFQLRIDREDLDAELAEVTIRDLLCHRTGFTRMGVLWAAGSVDRATVLKTATKAEPWSAFRKKFFYNNVMFLAAGEAAAVAAGKSWEELVTGRLLEPLGMQATDLSVAEAQKSSQLALGYTWNAEKEMQEHIPMRSLDAIAPAGAINSNVVDMAQWLRLQLGRGAIDDLRLVSAERIKEMWTPQIEVGDGRHYGLAWFLGDWNGKRVVQHGGNIDGFSAQVSLLPDDNVGFVLLTNATQNGLQATVSNLVWSALFDEPKEILTTDSNSDSDQEVASEPGLSGEEDFADYVGTYIADYAQFQNEEFDVRVESGKLAIDIPSQRTYELLPPDKDGKRPFAFAPGAIQASFERNAKGEVEHLTLYQNGLEFEVPRKGVVIPPDGTEAEFAKYFGTYEYKLLPEPFTVLYHNGRLACDIPGQSLFELHLPDAEGCWFFRATDLLGLVFHENEAGEVTSTTFRDHGVNTECPLLERGSPELISLEDLLALRGCEAAGKRLDELETLRFRGKLRMVHAGVEGSTVSTCAGTGRFLEENDFEPFGWSRTGFDGTRGWSDSAFQPFQELDGALLKQLTLSHPAVFFGDWRRFFDTIQVVRAGQEDGRRVWVVRLAKGELPSWLAFVDAETGDVVRLDAQVLIPGAGTLAQKITLSDHRDVEGLRLPFHMATETPMNGRFEVTYDTIETGVELPEGFFAPPTVPEMSEDHR